MPNITIIIFHLIISWTKMKDTTVIDHIHRCRQTDKMNSHNEDIFKIKINFVAQLNWWYIRILAIIISIHFDRIRWTIITLGWMKIMFRLEHHTTMYTSEVFLNVCFDAKIDLPSRGGYKLDTRKQKLD